MTKRELRAEIARLQRRLLAIEAWEMRLKGLSYQDIGDRLGVGKSTAFSAVGRAIREKQK